MELVDLITTTVPSAISFPVPELEYEPGPNTSIKKRVVIHMSPVATPTPLNINGLFGIGLARRIKLVGVVLILKYE